MLRQAEGQEEGLRLRRAWVAWMALAAAGCGGETLTGPSAVTGETWRLRSLQRADFSIVTADDPDRYTIAFGEEARLSVRADCNRCFGSYELDGESFRPGLLACTRAACPADSLDGEFLRILEAGVRLGVRDGVLEIRSDAGVLRLTP